MLDHIEWTKWKLSWHFIGTLTYIFVRDFWHVYVYSGICNVLNSEQGSLYVFAKTVCEAIKQRGSLFYNSTNYL